MTGDAYFVSYFLWVKRKGGLVPFSEKMERIWQFVSFIFLFFLIV